MELETSIPELVKVADENLFELIHKTRNLLEEQVNEALQQGFQDAIGGKPERDLKGTSDLFQRYYLESYKKGMARRNASISVAKTMANFGKHMAEQLDESAEAPNTKSPRNKQKKEGNSTVSTVLIVAMNTFLVMTACCIGACIGYKLGVKSGMKIRSDLERPPQ